MIAVCLLITRFCFWHVAVDEHADGQVGVAPADPGDHVQAGGEAGARRERQIGRAHV